MHRQEKQVHTQEKQEYAAHRNSKCTAHYTPESSSGLSVKQLLETSTKPTQLVVRLPKGGQVHLL